ncbi:MAG TPA: hypothetical protein VFP26_06485 [Gemmatimonadaceae bacterium]|jgi:hypothetical protein|nr:hypothetical protein [Gemmatimonadaceae bacterium]
MQNPSPAVTVVAQATPQATTPPPATTGPNPFAVVVTPQGTQTIPLAGPRTQADVDALKARRSELSNQLESVDSRRSSLMKQLSRTGDPVAVKGLEARLQLLDARQIQLESDLQQTGQLLSSASAGLITSTSDPARFGSFTTNQSMALSVLGIIFIGFPLAIGIAKSMWRRSIKPGVPPQALTETAQRLERLESSVDAIAIEIERISEGQRFVTKLLSEGQPAPAIGAGSSPETVRAVK